METNELDSFVAVPHPSPVRCARLVPVRAARAHAPLPTRRGRVPRQVPILLQEVAAQGAFLQRPNPNPNLTL